MLTVLVVAKSFHICESKVLHYLQLTLVQMFKIIAIHGTTLLMNRLKNNLIIFKAQELKFSIEKKGHYQKTGPRMFTEALPLVAQNWKPP